MERNAHVVVNAIYGVLGLYWVILLAESLNEASEPSDFIEGWWLIETEFLWMYCSFQDIFSLWNAKVAVKRWSFDNKKQGPESSLKYVSLSCRLSLVHTLMSQDIYPSCLSVLLLDQCHPRWATEADACVALPHFRTINTPIGLPSEISNCSFPSSKNEHQYTLSKMTEKLSGLCSTSAQPNK